MTSRRFIDIAPDLAVLPCNVGAVKRLGPEECVVFLCGQSAADGGFKIDRAWEDVVDELTQALEEEEEGEGERDDKEDEDDDNET